MATTPTSTETAGPGGAGPGTGPGGGTGGTGPGGGAGAGAGAGAGGAGAGGAGNGAGGAGNGAGNGAGGAGAGAGGAGAGAGAGGAGAGAGAGAGGGAVPSTTPAPPPAPSVSPKNNTIISIASSDGNPVATFTYILAQSSTSPILTSNPTSSDSPSPAATGTSQPKAKSNVGPIIGALLGGLVAGAVVAAAILFCLRSRRRHSTKRFAGDEVTSYPSAAWQREKDGLVTQLNDAQAERAQLRTYLQVVDTRDPRDVVELFEKLNVSIKNSCLLASGAVLKSVEFKPSGSTKGAKNLPQLQKALEGANALIMTSQGKGRKIDEFLPLSFSYVVNLTLVNNLFSLFHPEVSKAENESLLETYRGIRLRDPQRLSARWRCSTYAAIDGHTPSSGDWPNHFADTVLKNISSILSSIFGEHIKNPLPAKFRGELISIGTEAYKWNRTVKSTFYGLDFHPVLFTSADRFDPASMSLYLSHKPDEIPPRHIVAAATLALRSAESVVAGDSVREESVWQTKAEVLTEGFF